MANKADIETNEMDEDLDLAAASGDALKNMAAATTAGGIPKNFRQQADMEAFYRFVHENDLREEALVIFDQVRAEKHAAKAAAKKIKH